MRFLLVFYAISEKNRQTTKTSLFFSQFYRSSSSPPITTPSILQQALLVDWL
jgi:hypothetical protein